MVFNSLTSLFVYGYSSIKKTWVALCEVLIKSSFGTKPMVSSPLLNKYSNSTITSHLDKQNIHDHFIINLFI